MSRAATRGTSKMARKRGRRSAKQVAAQKKASLASARKRRKSLSPGSNVTLRDSTGAGGKPGLHRHRPASSTGQKKKRVGIVGASTPTGRDTWHQNRRLRDSAKIAAGMAHWTERSGNRVTAVYRKKKG